MTSEFVQASSNNNNNDCNDDHNWSLNNNGGNNKAKLELKDGSSTYSHTSTRPWSLAKTGAVDPLTKTVTWSINATQGSTGARRLVVNGRVKVKNNGGIAAPIGNVVVTLESKSGNNWIIRSSDVANATNGDAATTAKIINSGIKTITENSASGSMAFANAQNNNVISLSPQVLLPAGATVDVKFTASFNNDVLNLATGTKVRAEVFVSFGNAGNSGTSNVDINGNGGIDSYETRVDTESDKLGEKTVPAATTSTTSVTLTDTLSDITKTGTVTFSNAVFNLGATMGTVRVNYDGGTAGGTVTNCAHLIGSGVNLVACNAQNIAPERFEWMDGDVVTLRQGDWDVASMLTTPQPFSLVFPTGLVVGTVGVPNRYSILLTNGPAVQGYLATGGPNTALTSDHINPTLPFGGLFGGDLVATTLNVGFSAGGQLGGTFNLGDLYLCALTSPTVVNNTTVSSFVATANALLGGDVVAGITIDEAAQVAAEINAAFLGGVPSAFADGHLSPTPCSP